MNLHQLQYVIEIQKTRSFTAAAERLCISQPNLSRRIRDLEQELGFEIFRRTSKGVLMTDKGNALLEHASEINMRMSAIRHIALQDYSERHFRVSAPRSSYIALAYARFLSSVNPRIALNTQYKETDTMQAINDVLTNNFHLAVIRYPISAERKVLAFLAEKNLKAMEVATFACKILLSRNHPLAPKDKLTLSDLASLTELTYGEAPTPSFAEIYDSISAPIDEKEKKIKIFDRASKYTLLSRVNNTYMRVAPMDQELLNRFHLICKEISDQPAVYRDMLLHTQDYSMRKVDIQFLSELKKIIYEFY